MPSLSDMFEIRIVGGSIITSQTNLYSNYPCESFMNARERLVNVFEYIGLMYIYSVDTNWVCYLLVINLLCDIS